MWYCEIPNLEKKYLQFFRPIRKALNFGQQVKIRPELGLQTCLAWTLPWSAPTLDVFLVGFDGCGSLEKAEEIFGMTKAGLQGIFG